MAWDFTADSEKQTEIAKKISDAADKFDEKVDAMYSQIGNMGTYWVGEDYNAYKEGTEGYRNALSDLSDSLRMYSKHFEKVATGTDELSTELISIINDMTGSGAGAAGGNGATGNGVTPGANGGNDALTGSNTNGNVEAPTGNPTGGNVTNNETPGNPSGDKTNNVEIGGTPNNVENKPAPVTVSSGQEVTLNGEKCYFLLRDSSGNEYYTKSTDANAQVFIRGENNSLSPYELYGNGKIVSREDFVNKNKLKEDYQWNVTYNNGSTPYDSIGSNVDSSFTANVAHPNQSFVINDYESMTSNPSYLKDINFSAISNGKEQLPEVIYVGPGETIRWNPTDFLNFKDVKIEGGSDGRYLCLDHNSNTYYTLNSDGTYYADGGDDISYSSISADRLLSKDTTIKTK